MLRKIRQSLKEDGKLVIVEYRKEDQSLSIPRNTDHIQEIRSEIEPDEY